MVALFLSLILATGNSILPFPGTTYSGKITAKDKTECRVVLWDGLAPYLPLLSNEEQKRLEAALKDVESNWQGTTSWPERAKLLSPYHHVLFDRTRSLPLQRKGVKYQQIALHCGADTVRGALVDFPPIGAGGLIVLKHPVQPEYVVFVDVEARAQEQVEGIATFIARYRAELEKAEDPEALPREIQKEMALLQKNLAEKSRRIQFWDINGMVLPSCPGACPAGTLAYAWGQLSSETRRAFAVALGVLALPETAGEEEHHFGLLMQYQGAWPKELGENKFLGAVVNLERLGEALSFSPPEPEMARELWGRSNPRLPTFSGDLKRTIRDILRGF